MGFSHSIYKVEIYSIFKQYDVFQVAAHEATINSHFQLCIMYSIAQ